MDCWLPWTGWMLSGWWGGWGHAGLTGSCHHRWGCDREKKCELWCGECQRHVVVCEIVTLCFLGGFVHA